MNIQGGCGCSACNSCPCSAGQCQPRKGPPPFVKAAVFQALGRPPQSREEAKAVIQQLRASGQLPPRPPMGGGQGCPCCQQQGGGCPGGMSSSFGNSFGGGFGAGFSGGFSGGFAGASASVGFGGASAGAFAGAGFRGF